MKKVIFVCLLTLSVCLSQPAGEQGATSPTSPAGSVTQAAPAAPGGAPTTAGGPTQAPAGGNPTQPPTISTTVNTTLPTTKPTEPTKPTSEAAPPATTVPTKPTKANDITTAAPTSPVTGVPINGTTTSTQKPTTPKATAVPTLQARGFDGASFVGGIILTLGLIAIGFMGFKYYKAQTERNYHTL
ncbi:visgun [Choristoneura fumiferana]|uniref:visgun n=1 Tax=Choristoneura fumiferana TaxID=7141 RepID=UPI003D157C36